VGFKFDVAREALKNFQEEYPGLLRGRESKRLIFAKELQQGAVNLIEFDVEKVIAV
jgi:hypothetical protein